MALTEKNSTHSYLWICIDIFLYNTCNGENIMIAKYCFDYSMYWTDACHVYCLFTKGF